MLIKINTMKYEKYLWPQWKPDTSVILNPESIVLVTHDTDDDMHKIKCADATVYWVNADEYARLEPILLNIPAPVAAVSTPSPADPTTIGTAVDYLLPILDEYAGCLRGHLCDMGTMEGQNRAAKIRDEILNMFDNRPSAAALPSDVIAAYRDYVGVCAGKYTYATEKTALNRLGDTLKAYMPAAAHEESDNDE